MEIDEIKLAFNNFEPEVTLLGEHEYYDFYQLEVLLDEIFSKNIESNFVEDMFRIYEKYPNEDNDYFWSMLHGIERVNNYEDELLRSINRKPSKFGLLMINRILNADIHEHNGIDLLGVLSSVSDNEKIDNEIRDEAKDFFDYQIEKNEDSRTH